MGTPIGGTAFLKVDGHQYALRGNLTISGDASEREGIAGMDGVHGFVERPRVPQISADLSFTDGLSVTQLRAQTAVTVTAELSNGRVFVLRDAWTSEPIEVNAADGQLSVVWQGEAGEWLS